MLADSGVTDIPLFVISSKSLYRKTKSAIERPLCANRGQNVVAVGVFEYVGPVVLL